MDTSPATSEIIEQPVLPGSTYPLYGTARTGGAYNSHLVSGFIFALLTLVGAMNVWLTIWLELCLLIGMILDHRTWKRKIALAAIPSQMMLYLQVLARAVFHVLPYYVFAFLIYVCMAPIINPFNIAITSFGMLYGFYMIMRVYWVLRYLWTLNFHWENAGRTFATHQANLKSKGIAIRHVLWAYFLGNVGLVVRCASQVLTIGLFELLRQKLSLNIAVHPTLSQHVPAIFTVATLIWLVTLWWADQPALLIYYRTHRTFHTCRPLYDCIHSIHHKGVLPTHLDSGTISPLEFFITEMVAPATTLVPNWWWALSQSVLAFAGHLPSHDTNSKFSTAQHHLLHHRLFNVNFGLIPVQDEQYGTRYVEPKNASDEAQVALS